MSCWTSGGDKEKGPRTPLSPLKQKQETHQSGVDSCWCETIGVLPEDVEPVFFVFLPLFFIVPFVALLGSRELRITVTPSHLS